MQWIERRLIAGYVAGLALGGAIGLLVPAVAQPAEAAILPILALLLYVTFLGIPFDRIGRAVTDRRFRITILVLNYVLVPLVVWLLTRIVVHDPVLLVGVLFVLLTPCIDYVIVFAGLAGGDAGRLLAAAPVLMLAQMLLLPLYLWLMVGSEFLGAVDLAPFLEAFVLIIALPLVAAALTQLAARRHRIGAAWTQLATGAMVPLMVATLAAVVASKIAAVGARLGALLLVIPVYVLFAALMVPLGAAV